MAKTCSNCKHSCHIEQPGTDEMTLVCINGNSYFGFTKVGENDRKKCWESVKEDDYEKQQT